MCTRVTTRVKSLHLFWVLRTLDELHYFFAGGTRLRLEPLVGLLRAPRLGRVGPRPDEPDLGWARPGSTGLAWTRVDATGIARARVGAKGPGLGLD